LLSKSHILSMVGWLHLKKFIYQKNITLDQYEYNSTKLRFHGRELHYAYMIVNNWLVHGCR